MEERISILGVPVNALTRRAVLDRCATFLQGETLHQVVTANPEFVLAARGDPRMRQLTGDASLVVPDGVGLLWAARWYGRALPERIPGVELLVDICRLAREAGQRVSLIGGRQGAAQAAAQRLAREISGLDARAFAHEHAAASVPAELWHALAAVRPAVVFVAYGQPAQEVWIQAHRERLTACGVRIAMGVGGAFDMLAGRLPRAPWWMQRAGLEWLWRLLLEPRRLPRILRATVSFPLAVVLRERRWRDSASG